MELIGCLNKFVMYIHSSAVPEKKKKNFMDQNPKITLLKN